MLNRSLFARTRTRWIAALAIFGGMALLPAAAQAGAGAGTSIQFPGLVTVGQSGLTGSLTLVNLNTGGEAGLTNSVCNVGDPSPPCLSTTNGIRLVPTCKQIGGGTCLPAGADPGVFQLAGIANGKFGTTCQGMTFDVTPVGDAFGAVFVTPQGGAHVTLPGFGATCVIDLTFSVLKSPTGDQDPNTPGKQTTQATQHGQFVGTTLPAPTALNSGAQGSSTGTTVERAAPTINTDASADISVGGSLSDHATVSSLVNPVAGATVTFRLYGPGDTTCSGASVFTDNRPVTLAGSTGTAQSGTFQPTVVGSYRWVATYDGDANNLPAVHGCGIANETRTVSYPCTPPPGTPPPGGTVCKTTLPPPPPPPPDCTSPPGPAPAGGELCARGTAAIRGRTGCQGAPFNVLVSGRQITRVVFAVDGKVVRSLNKPNSGSRYKLAVSPRRLSSGVHRVVARTTFAKRSGTKSRVLRVTFSRCVRRAAAPAFTG